MVPGSGAICYGKTESWLLGFWNSFVPGMWKRFCISDREAISCRKAYPKTCLQIMLDYFNLAFNIEHPKHTY